MEELALLFLEMRTIMDTFPMEDQEGVAPDRQTAEKAVVQPRVFTVEAAQAAQVLCIFATVGLDTN